jgi:hypothetical protein
LTNDNRPFLLLVIKNRNYSKGAKALIKRAISISDGEQVQLFSLAVKAFETDHEQLIKHFNEHTEPMFISGGSFISHDSTASFWADRFDRFSLHGDGVLGSTSDQVTVFDEPLVTTAPLYYEASLWVKAIRETTSFPVLYYRQYDEKGKTIDQKEANPKLSSEVLGEWVRIDIPFQLKKSGNRVEFFMKGKQIVADDFLIRPTDIDVYHNVEEDGELRFNNYPFEPSLD